MKTVLKLAALAGIVTLGACSGTPAENNAANVQESFDNIADNMEAIAGDVSNEAVAENLSNSAEQLRDAGSNAADVIRDSDNANNVESNTVGM